MALSRWFSSPNKVTQFFSLQKSAGVQRAFGIAPVTTSQIASKIKQDPYYRFQSDLEIEIASQLGIKIDVNIACVDDWLRLPGISITQARNLVEITNSGIHFLCLEDLAAALGVSVLKIQSWQPILYFAYYADDSFHAPAKMNPNNASLNQLLKIPNLTDAIARQIIVERESNGNYRHIADMQKRLNLTPDFAYHLMNYFQF